jgi:branched-chain amino acid aminotransferase
VHFDREASEIVDLDWDGLGFGLVQTDFMYFMRTSSEGTFDKGELLPFGPIQLNPSAAVLNYGQVS